MTGNEAIKILLNLYQCVDTDACDADCDACRYNDDQTEIYEAIDMACNALKNSNAVVCADFVESDRVITARPE